VSAKPGAPVAERDVECAVHFAGISLRNPVLTASGTFGYGTEFAAFLDLRRLGGIVSKSVSLEPREGNLPARIAETPAGMLNAIGLENVGVDAFVREKLPALP
jgi:dihydroorotate dehydrogenase (NAD+) catalytic subunit